MKFYRVKPKYRRWVVGTKLYTPEERAKIKLVPRRCFEVLDVDIPESEAYNWVFSRLKHDNWEENKVKIKNGNETVYEIITNHDFTLDEAIAFAGKYSNDAAINGEPEVTINGKKYYYEELSLEW